MTASVIGEVQNVYEARAVGEQPSPAVARVALARFDTGETGYRSQQRAARELLGWLAQSSLEAAGVSFSVRTTASGQPMLLAGGAPVPELSVSLSHSRDWVAAGLARGGRLGIDVERENPRRRVGAMAEWMGWPECREPGAFYRAWTYREARIKCRGGALPAADEDILTPAREGDSTGLHHALMIRPTPDVYACMLLETERNLRMAWSAIGTRRLPTWS